MASLHPSGTREPDAGRIGSIDVKTRLPLFRRYPLGMRFGLFVVLPLLLVGGWWVADLRRSLPAEGTTRLVAGTRAPVALTRDAQGAVHIAAANDDDAYYAMGYAHAQDRLWQMEVQRRMASGRLSEIFGRQSVDADVWFRTLGLYESARTAWPHLSRQAQASLRAYTRGVNAVIARSETRPVEFAVLRVEPQPWTELDSLAWTKVFALNLGGNFRREIDRHLAGRVLSPEQLKVFFPGYPAGAPTTISPAIDPRALQAWADTQDRLQDDLRFAQRGTGSNAWAVSGRWTANGGALLANDPHLGLQMPSLWYAVGIDTPTLKVSGMSLVGLPVVVFGRNQHIAWGGTNMMADTQDLFVERADVGGKRYLDGTQWRAFEVRDEVIHVRADFPDRLRRPYAPIRLKVRQTRHGPVVSDRLRYFDAPVALRWTGLDSDDTSYESFYRLGYARDWDEFRQALQYHVAPAMNMLYADRAGNIGYVGVGRLPLRRQGEGTVPVAGWDGQHEWIGHVPPAEWPQVFNPPSGYLVSANHRVVGPEYPYFISHEWAPPARARRIEQLLRQRIDAGRKLGVEDMKRIQGDTLDLEAAAMMEILRTRLPRTGRASQAANYLATWRGDMAAESQAAAIFHAWMRHFRRRVFDSRLQSGWKGADMDRLLENLGANVTLSDLGRLLQEDNPWCARGSAAAPDSCAALLAASLDDALRELHKLRGDWSMRSWHWDTIQQTHYAHTPLSRFKPLDRLFDRRIGNGGSSDSINVASSHFVEGKGYVQQFGPGFRQVIMLGPDGIGHEYMNSTGQSGNIVSPHYADMVEPFRNLEYVRLATPARTRPARPQEAQR